MWQASCRTCTRRWRWWPIRRWLCGSRLWSPCRSNTGVSTRPCTCTSKDPGCARCNITSPRPLRCSSPRTGRASHRGSSNLGTASVAIPSHCLRRLCARGQSCWYLERSVDRHAYGSALSGMHGALHGMARYPSADSKWAHRSVGTSADVGPGTPQCRECATRSGSLGGGGHGRLWTGRTGREGGGPGGAGSRCGGRSGGLGDCRRRGCRGECDAVAERQRSGSGVAADRRWREAGGNSTTVCLVGTL